MGCLNKQEINCLGIDFELKLYVFVDEAVEYSKLFFFLGCFCCLLWLCDIFVVFFCEKSLSVFDRMCHGA